MFNGDRLKEILEKSGCSSTAEYLKKQGYVKYPEFGWILEERLQECVNKGLVKYDEKKEMYVLTDNGCKYKTIGYMGDSYPRLYERGKDEELERNPDFEDWLEDPD